MKKILTIGAVMLLCFWSEEMKAQMPGSRPGHENFFTEEVLLVGCILILTGLAWWLIRNSLRLSEAAAVKSMEEEKDWLHQQLYDLDAEQIDVLIKHITHQMAEMKNSTPIK